MQSKPGKKKTYEDKDTALRIDDETLDDPVAEKLRRQRYDLCPVQQSVPGTRGTVWCSLSWGSQVCLA